LRADPIGIEGGLNLYLFAKANPIRFKDVYGLKTCGSGWNEPIVPDNPIGFKFSSCCANHDKCYETCGETQAKCDNDFESCMLNVCKKIARPMRRNMCEKYARRYANAVRKAGGSAFSNAQKKCCNQQNKTP
jgi:hypothetical protein